MQVVAQPVSVIKSDPQTQSPPTSATVTRLHPQTEPTPRSAPPPVSEKSPPPALPETPVSRQASDDLNWSERAFELKLGGIAREFAINSIVKSWADQRLHLVFKPELEVMLKPELEAQIKQAIEQQLGVSLKLELSSQPVLEVETPSEAQARKQEQERQQAIRAIRQDAMVQQLQNAFGVELIESSVKKINPEIS